MSLSRNSLILKQRFTSVSRYLMAFWLMATDASASGNYSVRRDALTLTLRLPSTVAKLLGGRP